MASPSIKAVRGTRDLLPPETELWNRVEATARAVFARYHFNEIRTPVFEATELFVRGVGEGTDIVSKEMFTWDDGRRPVSKTIEQSWTETNKSRLANKVVKEIEGLRSAESYAYVDVDKVPTYVEFRATLLKVPNKALVKRRKRAETIGRKILIVTTRPIASYCDTSAYLENGINIEIFDHTVGRSWQSLCLRPENTAGVVRAYIEHKLGDTGNLQKLFYIGPQFRRERPQRGRYRQFWQIGAEVIGPPSSGSESPIRDAEVLEMLATLLDELGIAGWNLSINSVGSATDRPRYVAALREALAPIKDRLCPDNQRRAETNPLRVLDSKDEADQDLINALPKIADFLDEASTSHFQQVLAALDACGVPYTVNPRLVRGLDYYTRTTFEFTHSVGLGSQNALLGGGRYDGLSEMLGGPRAPGIGFAIGEDRLILTLQAQAEAAGTATATPKIDAYIAPMGAAQNAAALALARELRREGLSVETGDGSFRLKKSFDVADGIARHIVILGEDEVATSVYTVKTFASAVQTKVERGGLGGVLRG